MSLGDELGMGTLLMPLSSRQWDFSLQTKSSLEVVHGQQQHMLWGLEAFGSLLFITFAVYKLYLQKRPQISEHDDHGPTTSTLRLSPASATFLLAQGGLIATLIWGLYDTLVTFSDKSVGVPWPVVKSVALISSILASISCILLIAINSSKLSRLVFNLIMSILSSLSGLSDGWTPLAMSSTVAYVVSVMADGWLQDGGHMGQLSPTTVFGYLSYSFIAGYIMKGQTRHLVPADVPALPKPFKPERLHGIVERDQKDGSTALPGFWYFILLTCRSELAISFLWQATDIVAKFAQPWVLQAFLAGRRPSQVIGILLLGLLHALATAHGIFQLRSAGAKLKGALGSQVFEKAFQPIRTRREDLAAVNLVEIDVYRIQEFVNHIHVVWSTPLQAIFSLVSLGMILGWQSGLAAAGSVIVMIPFYWVCNSLMQKYQVRVMLRKDARVSLTSETVANTFMLKLWAQEPLFEEKLATLRRLELGVSQALVWVSSVMSVLVKSASTFISVAAFLVAIAVHSNLTSEQIFPALMFCNLLILPLTMLPLMLASWASCIVSYRRLQTYCAPEQVTTEPRATEPRHEEVGSSGGVTLSEVSLSWPDTPATCYMDNVTFTVHDGELVTLCGPSSGGKSTIIKMIIGALKPTGGSIAVGSRLAYMSQEQWLATGTIRENILFGRELNDDFYGKVIESCALNLDFELMPLGDATLIGSHSTGLSGGQKSRITLARAIYARADIYLLDDPLAALDVGVQHYVIENVLGPRGILKGSTRIIATNSKAVLALADRVLEVSQGTVLETSAEATLTGLTPTTTDGFQAVEESIIDDILAVKPEATDSTSVHTFDLDDLDIPTNETSALIQGETEESRLFGTAYSSIYNLTTPSTGLIPLTTYLRWFRIAGLSNWVLMAAVTALSYISSVYARYMLKDVGESFSQGSAMLGLELYTGASAIQAIMTFIGIIMGWYLCMKPTAQSLHDSLVSGVLKCPMQFLHSVPTGEILNRFANDLARNDGPLFFVIFGVLATILMVGSSLAVFIMTMPMSIVAICPLLALCWWLLQRVLAVLVDTKRLETSSRSPLITNLQDTMDGSDIIRVFGRYSDFKNANYINLTRNIEAFLAFLAVDMWLMLRLSLVSIVLQGLAAFGLIITNADPGTTGLVMSYMLTITQSLSGMILLRTALESDMVSIQRIFALADIKPESKVVDGARARPVPAAWPHHGRITFKNFTAAYNGGKIPALKNVSLNFIPGQSTAIVGRTGAGKSSLAVSLLRVLDPAAGSIDIDGLNIAQVDLPTLRSRVAIIPQNCRAFAGTVRSNLDPDNHHDESNLLRVVSESMLAGYFASPEAALNHSITKGGSNLSSGQLQLLAVARCLLLDTNIVILDEVTAAVDHSVERVIHQVLMTQFRDKTRIIISHRLENVIENDRIVVLDKGEVVEIGAPHDLFANGGVFKDMILAAGLEDRLS